ncbi:Arabinogalactan protein 22 [Castilleja foliolosa]|uniref:Arabinogalactan protein 22 n=1 Tax=Castilleja foliolosa TaxID=1961234 RepID=A0ABD3EK37_9LAMI
MEMIARAALVAMVVMAFAATVFPSVSAHSFAPAPSPSSDGTAIDQGIAYVLMFLALALTYIIH